MTTFEMQKKLERIARSLEKLSMSVLTDNQEFSSIKHPAFEAIMKAKTQIDRAARDIHIGAKAK